MTRHAVTLVVDLTAPDSERNVAFAVREVVKHLRASLDAFHGAGHWAPVDTITLDIGPHADQTAQPGSLAVTASTTIKATVTTR